MAESWRTRTIYPPRYFAGHVTVLSRGKKIRVEFYNAMIIPVSPHEALVFCAGPGDLFYGKAAREFSDLHNKRLVDIQYAISVYDARRDGYQVEKFNHPFETDTRLYFGHDHLRIACPDGSPIYGEYKVCDVLDNLPGCEQPVTQFIS